MRDSKAVTPWALRSSSIVRWSRGRGAELVGEVGGAGWDAVAAAAAGEPCGAAVGWAWGCDCDGCEVEETPLVAGCVWELDGWDCDWVLLTVWDADPGEEEGTPFV